MLPQIDYIEPMCGTLPELFQRPPAHGHPPGTGRRGRGGYRGFRTALPVGVKALRSGLACFIHLFH